ncbi:MAG TPA: DoxX family protein [Bacteroidia bacterium]|nr:DoxX family protein [Bacteroidia bacterium]
MKLVSPICAGIAALIMLQTLYFKFSAAAESVYIFSALGAEPAGRIASGIAELVASILLLIPSTRPAGGLLGMGIMAGAILSHLLVLGIEVMNDGGQLFIYAIVTFTCCSVIVVMNRGVILNRIFKK